MKLTDYSKNKLMKSLAEYSVPKDYADPIYNYLVHGFHAGSFWNAVLANDFMGAIARSHPANTITGLKVTVSWIFNTLSNGVTHGSYDAVDAWLKMSSEDRRIILQELGLIYTAEEEFTMTLSSAPTHEIIVIA
jgi:hypothetical protein